MENSIQNNLEKRLELIFSQNPNEHYKFVQNECEQRINLAKSYYERCLSFTDSEEILTTNAMLIIGSDGRLEKGEDSPLEFVVLTLNSEIGNNCRYSINQCNNLISLGCDSRIEVKNFYQNLTFFENRKNQPWPGRILDSKLLAGNEELLKLSIDKIYNEFISDKNLQKYYRDRIKAEANTTLTGITRERKHFDPRTGEIFYNNSDNPKTNLKGLKYGPLRLIQETVMYEQLRNNIKTKNTSVVDKINDFFPNNEITKNAIEAYKDALYLYHLQADLNKAGKNQNLNIGIDRLNRILGNSFNFYFETKKNWKIN